MKYYIYSHPSLPFLYLFIGAYGTLINELCIEDEQQFRMFFRMTAVQIQYILDLIGTQISKKDTYMREAISIQQRVLVTLRFFASGTYN